MVVKAFQPLPSLGGLPQRLVHDGLLSESNAQSAIKAAKESSEQFVSVVVKQYGVNARELVNAAGQEFGLPILDLDVLESDDLPLDRVKEETVIQHHAIPLFIRNAHAYVGISDPANIDVLDDLKFQLAVPTHAVLVEEDKLVALIDRAFKGSSFELNVDELEDRDGSEDADNQKDAVADAAADAADEAPVVRLVNNILLNAINRGASDIHIEPYEKKLRVRYRIDGVLDEVLHPPLAMARKIIARIKVMSRMDISERRVPQDGRIKLRMSASKSIDFRVNACPTLFGEKAVLRILDSSSATLGIEKLGYEDVQRDLYLRALKNPFGMILVTGPTGSGKTVSLYTGLQILNEPDINIYTAEDPAEINLPGINQVNVNARVGLTFAEALRAFLRQDPDIIMVGEIRDLETASIAIKASQTGHLVLSTLHTNSAPQTLTRLIDMGVPAFNIAASVILIIAQRLCRRLCDACKQPDTLPSEALLEAGFKASDLPDMTIYRAVGCNKCHNGYKGRVGVYQVMPITEKIGQIIMSGGSSLEIADQASKEGVADLRQSALTKVKAGVVSLAEADRLTRD